MRNGGETVLRNEDIRNNGILMFGEVDGDDMILAQDCANIDRNCFDYRNKKQ